MKQALLPLLAAAALGACTSAPSPPPRQPAAPPPMPAASTASAPRAVAPSRYRCEQGIEFTVRYGDGGAVLDAGPRGREQLLRDAGGVTPQQTVFSNPQLRAEFGLGPTGEEARLHYASPPLEVRCTRQ